MRRKTKNNGKLGFQSPKGYRCRTFHEINIDGDLHYCESHNFVYNCETEEEKLYNAIPCFYTDSRYRESWSNFYKETYIAQHRSGNSLKTCIRKVLKTKNIPVGTIVDFRKCYYIDGKDIDLSYKFKVKKENNFDPQYVNDLFVGSNFSTCQRSIELVNKLRENGFIVRVYQNKSFIGEMINSAVAMTGTGDFYDSKIEGEVAIAYGYNKKIGFSSYDNDFQGYWCGEKNILYDFFGNFDKWSRCYEIPKDTNIDDIIAKLKKDKVKED